MVSSSEVFEVWRDRRSGGTVRHYLPQRVSFRTHLDGDLAVGDGEGIVYEVRVGGLSGAGSQYSQSWCRSRRPRSIPHISFPS